MATSIFEEAVEGHDLAGFDFARRLADFVEAFLQAAEQEEALVGILQIGQFRQVNVSLLDLVTDAAAIRRAVESMKAGSGDVTAKRDIRAKNLVTGTQINHIFSLSRAKCRTIRNSKMMRQEIENRFKLELASIRESSPEKGPAG